MAGNTLGGRSRRRFSRPDPFEPSLRHRHRRIALRTTRLTPDAPGTPRAPRSGAGAYHHSFPALPAQSHVCFRFLLGKRRINAGLPGEKVLSRAQDFGWTVRGGGFLERAISV